MATELWQWSAIELATAIREGKASNWEVVQFGLFISDNVANSTWKRR
ncbi:MAG: hypothetical protein GY805_08310 [Chloroflexi bacterium]|nr:hypothetical protein [Chloroflexota bacterium]